MNKNDLAVVRKLKKQNKKIAFISGKFNIIHPGHIRIIKFAKEIADIWELEIKHVNKGCRRFLEFIDLESLNTEFTSSKSSDFIERFAGKLNLEKQYIKIAIDISKNIHKLDIASTHEPPSVAAGCILLVSIMYHLDISKKQISDIFKISDVSL